MTQKIILDVDTGSDDAVAILLAGHHPALSLVAVTVTHGNAFIDTTLDNTLRVIQAGALENIHVYAGASHPLVGPVIPTYPTQNSTLPLPPTSIAPQKKRAADFIIDYYLSPDGPDTIFMPVGPQTNLALALRLEPRISSRIPKIVTMCGAYIEGNTTASAEFNILADPEAAHVVFNSGIPITMVGLEATAQALVTLQDIKEIKNIRTKWAQAAATIMQGDLRWFEENLGADGAQIYDAVAVASVINPAVLITKPMNVNIELNGYLTRGRTVTDTSLYRKFKPNVDVAIGANRALFIETLTNGLR
jgi:ribosylpyrimidine nucleosidase